MMMQFMAKREGVTEERESERLPCPILVWFTSTKKKKNRKGGKWVVVMCLACDN